MMINNKKTMITLIIKMTVKWMSKIKMINKDKNLSKKVII